MKDIIYAIVFAFFFALIFTIINWRKIKNFLLKNSKSEIKKLILVFNEINPKIIILIKSNTNSIDSLINVNHSNILKSINIDEKLLIIEEIPSNYYVSGKDNQIKNYIMDKEQNGKLNLYHITFTDKLFKKINKAN